MSNATLFCNSLGNFLLFPARFLFQGKTVSCVVVDTNPIHARPLFSQIKHQRAKDSLEGMCKTIASILCVVPGTLLGLAVKGCAALASGRLLRRYQAWKSEENDLKDPIVRATHEVAISLFQKNAEKLLVILTQLKEEGNLANFLDAFCGGGNLAFVESFHNLFPSQGNNRTSSPLGDFLISYLLSKLVDGSIAPEHFFSKMENLNEKPLLEKVLALNLEVNNPNAKKTTLKALDQLFEREGFFKESHAS